MGIGIGIGIGVGKGMGKKGLPPLYLGQVATGCGICTANSTTNKWANSRTPHMFREDQTSFQIVLPAWYWARTGTKVETSVIGSITYTASIEYPAGTFTQVKFSGANSGVATGAANLVSDPINLAIPKDTRFWVRSYAVATHSIVFAQATVSTNWQTADAANGAALEYGTTSAITDKTMGGTITPNLATNDAPITLPLAIIAQTRKPSILIVSDSKDAGFGDTFDANGFMGYMTKVLGLSYGFINAGSPGDTISEFLASGAKRTALQQYCSHVVFGTAINSLRSGTGQNKTAAAVLAEQQTAFALFAGKKIFTKTTEPSATSSNSFTTTANQTLNSNAVEIAAFNDAIRAGVPGAQGYFEIADQIESARNSGKWKVDGTNFKYTADGLHPSVFAHALIAASGAIDPARFVR